MADSLTAASPLSGWSEKFSTLEPALHVQEEPFVTMFDLWADPQGPTAAWTSDILGLQLPTTPGTSVSNGTYTLIWLGPEEWLITSDKRPPALLEAALRPVVVEHGGALVDVSAQRTTIHLDGPSARDVLAKGCSMDLHPNVFADGTAVQTTLALTDVILVADSGGTGFRILVRAAFAPYLADWLIDAGEEYGVDPLNLISSSHTAEPAIR